MGVADIAVLVQDPQTRVVRFVATNNPDALSALRNVVAERWHLSDAGETSWE
jgi:hypothetical protein